ncbi:MAG: undecaprenyl-diphosphate phosphatase [Planctomycetia bacterium]|nr:undecaprenyl-diphosphate phosphatase [Planctomycetia bacterium]
MTETIQLILLAVIQGVTEFLPVSSSAHLVFLNDLLERAGFPELEEGLMVGVLLHLASLSAILCYYWRPVLRLLLGRDMPLLKRILVGSIPVGIVGIVVKVFFDDAFESLFGNVTAAAWMLLVTAIFLKAAQMLSVRDPHHFPKWWRKNLKTLSYGRAFGIGCFQAVAVLPGISRSGSTITAGLFTGLKRNDAATFSFLLAIPAIGAAGLVEMLKLVKEGAGDVSLVSLGIAFVVCFFVSFLSLHLLIKILRTRRIGIFAWYLVPLALGMLLLQGLT